MGRKATGFDMRMTSIAVLALLLGMPAGTGCGGEKHRGAAAGSEKSVVEDGDRVQVEYTGKMETGAVFDESAPEAPLEFVVGSGQIISGFDRAVIGMEPGEEKTVVIEPVDAYGERDEEMVAVLARTDLPAEYKPEQGMSIRLQDNMGRPVPGTIVTVGSDSIMVDLNHPLAGKTLTFEIKVVGIWETAEQRPQSGNKNALQ